MIGKDKFLSNVPQCQLGIHVIVPVPGDLVFVSSCLVSLIIQVKWKENSGSLLRPHLTNSPDFATGQCANFTPLSQYCAIFIDCAQANRAGISSGD